jgi:hypothetical protein
MDRINLAKRRNQYPAVVNTLMKLWVPHRFGKFLSISASIGFSRRNQLHSSMEFVN